jgi:hypothetical protein
METVLSNGNGRQGREGPVMVDREWGRMLGAHQAKGARRVGNFYRLPRAEYLSLVKAHAKLNPADSPCFEWTASDDQAVAELLGNTRQELPCGR